MAKRVRPPRDVKPLKDLTSPEYPPVFLHKVVKKKPKPMKGPISIVQGGKVSPR